MKNILTSAGVVALLLAFPSFSWANCESGHWLQTKNDDGTILTLEDGSVWRVTGGGELDSQLWLQTDELLVCDDGTIINKDESNEQVDVQLLSR
ncbi:MULTISPECIES: hypothetical protein [Enterobacter]|uniref:hypothetical protein n=1 Tax=Enterobacter TaxID=547 RepID=UPI0013E397B3|nr:MULTISPECIES: hypothetical protein [Enterobacter]